jgi:hypothetical protein
MAFRMPEGGVATRFRRVKFSDRARFGSLHLVSSAVCRAFTTSKHLSQGGNMMSTRQQSLRRVGPGKFDHANAFRGRQTVCLQHKASSAEPLDEFGNETVL